MTFKKLEAILYPLELFITDRKWNINDAGNVVLEGKVSARTENGTPCFHKRASYGDLHGSGFSVDDLAKDIWEKMIDPEAKLLLGSSSDYHSIIEWNESKKKLVKRRLTKAEEIEQNTSI